MTVIIAEMGRRVARFRPRALIQSVAVPRRRHAVQAEGNAAQVPTSNFKHRIFLYCLSVAYQLSHCYNKLTRIMKIFAFA